MDTSGDKESAPILVSGLKKLEYRGYDSAGVAVVNGNELNVVRATGKLKNLERRVARSRRRARSASATPAGRPTAVPRTRTRTRTRYEGVAVVHNGIIENHLALKEELRAKGHVFSSETDTEVFAHLISDELKRGAGSAGRRCARPSRSVRGTYALAVVTASDPNRIVCTKDALADGAGPGRGPELRRLATCRRCSSTRATSSSWRRATSPSSPPGSVEIFNRARRSR